MSEAALNALEQADDLLARGKIKQAIDALRAAVRADPDNRRALNKLGDLYVKSDQPDRAIAMFRRIGGGFQEDGLSAQAIALFKKVVRIDPEQWDAYETLGDLYSEQALPFEAAAQYEVAARAYLRAEDYPAAIRAHQGIINNRPVDAAARAKLAEIYLMTRRVPQALEEYAVIGRQMIAAGESEQALAMYTRVLESHFDAGFARRAVEDLRQGAQSAVAARLAVLVDGLEGEHGVASEVEDAAGDEVELEVLGDDAAPPAAELPSEPVSPDEATAAADEGVEPAEEAPRPEVEAEAEAEVEVEAAPAEPEAPEPEAPVSPGEPSSEPTTAPGAEPTAAADEEVFEIDLSDFTGLGSVPTEELEETAAQLETSELDIQLVQLLAGIERDLEAGDRNRALRRLTAVRSRAGNNPLFRELWHRANHPEEEVDEAAAPVGEDLRGLGSQVQDSMMVAEASGADSESDSIEEIVAGFTRGLADALSPDDFDTHYNLGLGYQEMGLVDEAISEFQIAAKSSDHLVDAATMLGYAFRQRGLYDLAFEWYERARESNVATDEQRLAMRYEQAETQYEAEEIERAYQLFQEVYGVDSTFRDVAQRIDQLRTS